MKGWESREIDPTVSGAWFLGALVPDGVRGFVFIVVTCVPLSLKAEWMNGRPRALVSYK